MKIRPLQDRVVVRRMEEETKTSGGIVLPGSAAEKPNQGATTSRTFLTKNVKYHTGAIRKNRRRTFPATRQ